MGNIFSKLQTRSVQIESNLAAQEYTFVKFSTTTDGVVEQATDATAPVYILNEGYDGTSGARTGSVIMGGQAKLKVGGTVAAGDFLTADGSGLGVATTTANAKYGATALEAGVANDVVMVQVVQGNY